MKIAGNSSSGSDSYPSNSTLGSSLGATLVDPWVVLWPILFQFYGHLSFICLLCLVCKCDCRCFISPVSPPLPGVYPYSLLVVSTCREVVAREVMRSGSGFPPISLFSPHFRHLPQPPRRGVAVERARPEQSSPYCGVGLEPHRFDNFDSFPRFPTRAMAPATQV